jgi:hypothetical protein
MPDALEAASALEKALYAENDRLHSGEAKWSSATAIALLQAKTYAHRVRRFLGVGAIAEARKAFDAIGWQSLNAVFDGNADLAVAAAAVRELLAE